MTGTGRQVGVGALCPRGSTKWFWSEGCWGFPEGKWSTGLMMSPLSSLLAVGACKSAGCNLLRYSWSYREDLMEIMAGCVAVVLSAVPPHWFLPLYQNNLLCVAPNASVTFSAALFQPAVSEVISCPKILYPSWPVVVWILSQPTKASPQDLMSVNSWLAFLAYP